MECRLCHRLCGVDRSTTSGRCGAGSLPRIARAALHEWEEPCISGSRGSGTVFFSGCNLSCLFCQNHVLQDGTLGEACTPERIAELFLRLQAQGAHNVNLVTPTPHVHTLLNAIPLARERGLRIPIVYNTNAYDTVETIDLLDGLIDVYLPDFKYVSEQLASRFSDAPGYADTAAAAIGRMYGQVGPLRLDNGGMAVRGLIIRHLVLPGCVFDTENVLKRIAEIVPTDTQLSLMSQYVPMHRAAQHPPLDRRLTRREYARAVELCRRFGFENVYVQALSSADRGFTPTFTNYL